MASVLRWERDTFRPCKLHFARSSIARRIPHIAYGVCTCGISHRQMVYGFDNYRNIAEHMRIDLAAMAEINKERSNIRDILYNHHLEERIQSAFLLDY